MTTAYLDAANEIKNQIGGRSLFMLGAKHLCASQTKDEEPALSFKVGANAKKVTHIRVVLEKSDTYRMEFLACRGTTVRTVATVEGVYADQLHATIESNTGLYTRL